MSLNFKEFRGNSIGDVDKFIGKCLMSVTYMHSAHFAVIGVGSYSKHKALEEFYEEMQDLIDTFTEVHIGIVGEYRPSLTVSSDVNEVEYIRSIVSDADEIYKSVDSSLQSILDDIKSLCYKTIYKLTRLS